MFQSAPDAEAGRNTQTVTVKSYTNLFQSAPDAEAGRNLRNDTVTPLNSLFQSAPDAEAGRNDGRHARALDSPRFQSAPDAEAGRNAPTPQAAVGYLLVSIRSRRRGREKPECGPRPVPPVLFQSAPDAEAGRNPDGRLRPCESRSFNPLPTQRPGETPVPARPDRRDGVSIRSRRRGREKHGSTNMAAALLMFQSAPDAEAGRNGCSRRALRW